MTASKLYELKELLDLFEKYSIEEEDKSKVGLVIDLVENAIEDYEFEKNAKLQADAEDAMRAEYEELYNEFE